ncbi:hypothetical protein KC669_02840 [Candidatus Dojkabacteria bacterium]|uniref:Uncharacterized protein n=1 Tax=Candidatus Dojkabacteria bacterium TaxID=2099670 RepID=A0A955LBH1_9BACT|nr:hypothetical protein [Candidatus Dojkabacteria bacterium]
MCNVKRLHVLFKQKYNKIDSNHNKDFPSAFIDDFLYEAALDYVDIFGSSDQKKAQKYGFEVTQQRIDMLSTLVVDIHDGENPLLPINEISEYGFRKYEFELGTQEKPYMKKVRLYAGSSCGFINIDLEQHGDLNIVLTDAYQKPSTKWRRLVGVIKKTSNLNKSSLFVYSDNELTGLYGEYIKRPNKPFFGGYDTLEYLNGDVLYPSATSSPIDIDIPDTYCDLLVDIAVQNVSGNLKDYNHTNYLQQKSLNTI